MDFTESAYEKLVESSSPKPKIMTAIYKAQINFEDHVNVLQKDVDKDVLPTDFDWRSKLNATVYDQGACGSCWAISTVSAINDHYYIKFGKRIKFSWKQAMNCYQKNPCKGGNPAHFLKYLEKSKLVDESCNSTINSCHCENIGFLNYITLAAGTSRLYRNIKSIKYHLVNQGPMIAGMLVYENFKSGNFGPHGIYLDNVLTYDERGKAIFGQPQHFMGCHSVVVVGYGQTPHVETSPGKYETVKYWICRNTWGSNWGDNGHFKIGMHHVNKLVQLEKEYVFKNATLGGMLAFDISESVKSKFTFSYTLCATIGIFLLASIYFWRSNIFKLKT
jgi:hypothetical protein